MEIIKRQSVKYPIMVRLDSGEELVIPKQSRFSNEWLRKHGCSLMAEYIALQYAGVKRIKVDGKRVGIYPINLLEWHKLHTPKEVKAKVTVRGVDEGLDALAKGKVRSHYYKKVTLARLAKALSDGDIVIMERKKPIHTIVLLPDKEGVYVASHGEVKKAPLAKVAKSATTNFRYRGMIVIRKEK